MAARPLQVAGEVKRSYLIVIVMVSRDVTHIVQLLNFFHPSKHQTVGEARSDICRTGVLLCTSENRIINTRR